MHFSPTSKLGYLSFNKASYQISIDSHLKSMHLSTLKGNAILYNLHRSEFSELSNHA